MFMLTPDKSKDEGATMKDESAAMLIESFS
jgi:hypothetical protein